MKPAWHEPPRVLARADRFRPQAEHAGRQLVRSWCEFGATDDSFCDPGKLPGLLAEVARRTLDAIADGAEGFDGIYPFFIGAEQGVIDEFVEANQGFCPPPGQCGPLLEKINLWHREHRRDIIAAKLSRALENGDDTAPAMREFVALESEPDTGKQSLLERAYALRFSPDEVPPPDELCMTIGDVPIAARGNLTVIQGKSKVGKSALVSAVLGAAQRGPYQTAGDTLCVEWRGEASGAVLHLDTEQSRADWHALVNRSVTRSGMPAVSPRLISLPLVMFARSERLEILQRALRHERAERGGVDIVVLDGIADLCASPNDEAEALDLVSRVHALAQEHECAVFCILHENPSTDAGKTRGHLGSELNRKAFANLRIDKDAETSVSTIYGTDMRKRDLPKDQGFCFAWDDAAGMHVFQGRAAGLKAAQREAEATAESREFFAEIFSNGDAIGKNGPFPILTPTDASEIYRETIGNGKTIKPDAMKKRMQKAESLGVLGKASRNEWQLVLSGTSGNQRENGNHSRP